MSLCLSMARTRHLSPGAVRPVPGRLSEFERTLLPARIEIAVGASGPGRLRDDGSGRVYEGLFEDAPPPAGSWRVERLDDRSGRGRHFTVHQPSSAPVLVGAAPLLGGRAGVRTVDRIDSGFIMRFRWSLRRPFAMFAILEGSGSNRVISESINRMDEPIPDLANIIDFATSTQTDRPVPVAFQNGNGTPGITPLEQGRVHLVAAIWAAAETFVRVDGVEEGYERGLTNGLIADSLSLLNNPTVRHGQNRWLGLFGEYLLISGPLDRGRIEIIERRLAEPYGMSLPT